MKKLLRKWLGIDELDLLVKMQDKAISEYLFWLGALACKAKLSTEELDNLMRDDRTTAFLLEYTSFLSMRALESASLSGDEKGVSIVLGVREKVVELKKKHDERAKKAKK